jgi:SNF2 family DNA or RNA helicase
LIVQNISRTRSELRGYQRAAVQFIKDTKKCALFIDMGLGKSVSVLTAVRDLQQELELGRVLVTGPPRVAKKTWPDEIKTWKHIKGAVTHTSLQTTPKQRRKRLKQATDIHFISHDLIPWLDKETCGEHDYDAIVIDESSCFKNQNSTRWKAMRRLVARARYVILMTGTPAAEGLHHLWAQMFLIDGGRRLGLTEKAFKERYFNQGWGEFAKPEAKKFAEAAIRKRIEDVCFTLLDKDYAELPPRIDNRVYVDLDPDVMAQYREFVREYVLEVSDGTNINAVTAGALIQKLQQVANGCVLDADHNRYELHRSKLDALHDIVDEAAGAPMIVAYSHVADIDRIKAEFPHAVLLGNNPKTIDQWNEGKIGMLIAHPKSGGHGLNLQFGGSTLVWFGLTWSLELYMQLNKRLHRKGQTRTTVIHHILAADTIDERVMDSITMKDQNQNDFLHSLRRIIVDEYHKAAA